MGGKFHLKLNIGGKPIVNKYREGKMKRTLKRELKVPEIAEMEPLGGSFSMRQFCDPLAGCSYVHISQACLLIWDRLVRHVDE